MIPGFASFVRTLEILLSLPGIDLGTEFREPFSPFSRMFTTAFHPIQRSRSSWCWELDSALMNGFTGMALFLSVLEKTKALGLSGDRAAVLYTALSKGGEDAQRALEYVFRTEQETKKIEAALLLLVGGVTDIDVYLHLLSFEDPADAAAAFCDFRVRRADRPEPDEESDTEAIAVFAAETVPGDPYWEVIDNVSGRANSSSFFHYLQRNKDPEKIRGLYWLWRQGVIGERVENHVDTVVTKVLEDPRWLEKLKLMKPRINRMTNRSTAYRERETTDTAQEYLSDPFDYIAAWLALGGEATVPFSDFDLSSVQRVPAKPYIKLLRFEFSCPLERLFFAVADVASVRKGLRREIVLLNEYPSLEIWLEKQWENLPRLVRSQTSFPEKLLEALKESGRDWEKEPLRDDLAAYGLRIKGIWEKAAAGSNPSFYQRFCISLAKLQYRELLGTVPKTKEAVDKMDTEGLVRTAYALAEFYSDRLDPDAYFGRRVEASRGFIGSVYGKIERNDYPQGSVEIIPSRTLIDAYAAHKAKNCLPQLPHPHHFEICSLSDPHYVPCRIVLKVWDYKPRWMGTVMTNTYLVTQGGRRRLVLIIHGIDPVRTFYVDPKQFIDGITEGFKRIKTEFWYDMLLIPKSLGMQSSRPYFFARAIADLPKRPVRFEKGFYFPKTGPGNGAGNYYNATRDPIEPHCDFFELI